MAYNLDLQGRVALVTGSTRGIGWAAACQLAKAGATVILNGKASSQQLLERQVELRQTYGCPSDSLLCDVSDPSAVRDAYAGILKNHGRLDILVNNAGVLEDRLIGMISEDVVDRVIKVNLNGVLWNIQYAARLMMRQRSGSIINLTSIVGVRGNQGQLLYSSSKAAIIGMTQSAAKELAAYNIRVNAVAPGFIDTQMTRHLPPEKSAALRQKILLQRPGTPEDVAAPIVFLASDMASYISGQVLGVDGLMQI